MVLGLVHHPTLGRLLGTVDPDHCQGLGGIAPGKVHKCRSFALWWGENKRHVQIKRCRIDIDSSLDSKSQLSIWRSSTKLGYFCIKESTILVGVHIWKVKKKDLRKKSLNTRFRVSSSHADGVVPDIYLTNTCFLKYPCFIYYDTWIFVTTVIVFVGHLFPVTVNF